MAYHTIGIWAVQAGREDEFAEAWRDMASKTAEAFPGCSAILMRDRENPARFISQGTWDSVDKITAWRASPTFQEGVARIRPLLESFEPRTMDGVLSVGDT